MAAEPIFVTGGAGYIGCHTCKALAKAGYLPISFDNLSTGHAYAVKWGPFIEGDLNDKPKLSQALASWKPKAVLHFAADAIVLESMVNPGKYYANNVGSTIALLEAMQEQNIKNLVFSSSCATYGNPQFTPITESHPQNPINPYGKSKLMIEQILADYEMAHGFKSICLRYFNAAGADLETEVGENHHPETHLIPSIIQTALGIKNELVVYGTEFPTRDGSGVRDYIHVQDLADAHTLALGYLLANQKSGAFNLGTWNGSSVLEIIDAVQKFSGKTLKVRLERSRPGDPSTLTADYTLANKTLNWAPKCSALSTIIESGWKWHQLLIENAALLSTTMKRLEEKT